MELIGQRIASSAVLAVAVTHWDHSRRDVMGKSIKLLCLFIPLILFFMAPSICKAAPEGQAKNATKSNEGFWQLISVNGGPKPVSESQCYKETPSGGEGAIVDTTQNKCAKKGSQFIGKASWERPPKALHPGKRYTQKCTVQRLAFDSGLFQNVSLTVNLEPAHINCGSTAGDKRFYIHISVGSKSATAQQTRDFVFTAPPPGSANNASPQQIALLFCSTGGGYKYLYQWVQGEEKTEGSTDNGSKSKKEFVLERYKELNSEVLSSSSKKQPKGKVPRKDTGAGFSDISGQVSICNHADDPSDEDNWDFVDLRTKIHLWDHIRTGEGSSAIIGFSDMSTYIMGPDSEIMIGTAPKQKSKLALVWGNILINIKKMVKDGSMDIEMNQCSGGIKGTKLRCIEKGYVSEVEVYEGTVEVTSKATGQKILLHPGQGAKGTKSGISLFKLSGFDPNTPEKEKRTTSTAPPKISKPPEQNSAEPKKTNIPVDRSDERELQSLGQKNTQAKGAQTVPSVRDEGIPKGHTTKYGF